MRATSKKGWVLLLGMCLAGAGALLAVAQQPPPGEQKQGPLEQKAPQEETPYAMRVEVPLVNLDVTVTDRDGNLVSGLRREHFRVYADGNEQEVVAFAPAEAPLTTVLVMEATRAVGYILYDNVDATYLFLRQLRKGDWVALVGYDLKPRIVVDFTHDAQEIVNNLRRMQYGIGTFNEANMYDAVIETLANLEDVEGKKSIILIGTGLDTFSRHTWDDARKIARQHRTRIFAIGMAWPLLFATDRVTGDPRYSRSTQHNANMLRMDLQLAEAQLRDLAEQTGGRAYFPRFITELPAIYEQIGGMLRNQYTLAFRPKNFRHDGKFHKISVKLTGPDGKPLKLLNQDRKEIKYKIHARKGYYAPEA